jgi:hypothetical protein
VKDEERLLREAEELGVPWREILEAEIRAERIVNTLPTDARTLERMLAMLPVTALESWRVRTAIARLSRDARPGSGNGLDARRSLKFFAAHLRGRTLSAPAATLLAEHLLRAYRRVQELMKLRRCALQCRGSVDDRVARVIQRADCCRADAEWAVASQDEERLSTLDAAIRRARFEGFEIPDSRSEPNGLRRLREFLERRGMIGGDRRFDSRKGSGRGKSAGNGRNGSHAR